MGNNTSFPVVAYMILRTDNIRSVVIDERLTRVT